MNFDCSHPKNGIEFTYSDGYFLSCHKFGKLKFPAVE